MVFSGGESPESAPPALRMGQYHVGHFLAQSGHDTRHWGRGVVGHTHRETLSRKGFSPIYPDCNHPVGGDDDAWLIPPVEKMLQAEFGMSLAKIQNSYLFSLVIVDDYLVIDVDYIVIDDD